MTVTMHWNAFVCEQLLHVESTKKGSGIYGVPSDDEIICRLWRMESIVINSLLVEMLLITRAVWFIIHFIFVSHYTTSNFTYLVFSFLLRRSLGNFKDELVLQYQAVSIGPFLALPKGLFSVLIEAKWRTRR